jgi:hypothetical protein
MCHRSVTASKTFQSIVAFVALRGSPASFHESSSHPEAEALNWA